MPASSACLTMLALRVMSSYEELVQDPIRLAVSWLGQPFSLIESANCGRHASGSDIFYREPRTTSAATIETPQRNPRDNRLRSRCCMTKG